MSKYIDKIKEHFPGASINSAYGMCPGGFFKFGMREDIPGCTGDCALCWNAEAPEDEVYCDRDEYDIPEDWRAAPASEAKNIINAQAAAAETFNYAVLSAEMGDYLRRKEEQLKNEYMNFTANCGRIFAEAQERLAKNGFGDDNGLFRKWITSMGFSKSTVYRMIDIYKFRLSQIGTDEGQAFFDALPKTLQADISAPSAPPQLVEQVMNGDITTHKEYIELKKQLEAAEERNAVLSAEKEQFHRASRANLEKLNEERDRSAELEQRIKSLESQPRDVAVQADPEQERKFSETLRRLNLDFENYREEADRDLADMRNQRNAALDRAEAAEARLSTPKAESNIKSFLIKMTMDDFSALINTLENEPYLKKIIQKAQVIRL